MNNQIIKRLLVLYIAIIAFSIVPILSFGQNDYLYLNQNYNTSLQRTLDSSSLFHTSIRPYLQSQVNSVINESDAMNHFGELGRKMKNKKLQKSLYYNHVIQVNESDFKLRIDPLFNFEFGKDLSNDISTYVNTRGVQIMGSIGKKFSFYSNFYENQAKFPEYLNSYIERTGIIPGQGLKRDLASSYDYSRSSGYISYSPSKYLNVQFGSGKNFIGDGYRSLLLSDNSFNYPFLKITANVWKLKYMSLFTEFMDLQTDFINNERFNKKYTAIHYLSWKVNKKLSIGIFEAVIFPSIDSSGKRGFEMSYMNPIIFYRPVEYSIGTPDNVILGFNFSYNLSHNKLFYGQIILDEFRLREITNGNGHWTNKYGYQLGIKAYDLFKVKNLYAQVEYNRVRPYTYSHISGMHNYGHYNQPLAHPFGANFWESIAILRYSRDRLFLSYKFIYSKYGEDPEGENYGKDIYKSYETRVQEYDNEVGQGINTSLIYNNVEISYLINPSYNLNAVIGYTSRVTSSSVEKNTTNFIYIGIRTSIDNFYYDF